LWLLWVALLLAGTSLAAAREASEPKPGSDWTAIAEQIKQVPVLRGRFTQDKHIAGFSRPLRSSGHFLLVRERGILWVTEQPFASRLSINARGLRLQDDSQTRLLDSASEPGLAAVQRLLLNLLGGDLAALAADFDGQLLPSQDNDWRLRLRPRSSAQALLIEQIVLAGGAQVNYVELLEAQGDRSELRFSDFAHGPEPDAAETIDLER
jgi:hypothetical protein